jgi:hypothetical protein
MKLRQFIKICRAVLCLQPLHARETIVTRHPVIGCLKGTVHIPEGVDLTEPADPKWGD